MGSDTSTLGPPTVRTQPEARVVSLRAGLRALGSLGWTPDLAVLVALLAATTVFGRPFTKVGVPHLHVYVTEPALLAVAVLGVARCGVRGAWERVRAAVPAWPLLLFWVAGAIATLRGLRAFGLSMVVHDVGLAEYSVLLALIPIAVDTRRRLALLVRALVYASLLSIVFYAVTRVAFPSNMPLASPDYAVGIYLSIFVLAAAARLVVGLRVGTPVLVVALLAATLMAWLPARTVWVAMIAAALALAVVAPRGRRLRAAGAGLAVFVVAQGLAYPLGLVGYLRGTTATTAAAAPSVAPGGQRPAGSVPAATTSPIVAADDLSPVRGGVVVRGDAARGHLSRQIGRHEALDWGTVAVQKGHAYRITIAVKPLAPLATVVRLGDTSGLGWGVAVLHTAPRVAWQTFRRTFVATADRERVALIVDAPGAAEVRFDALRITPVPIRAGGAASARHPRPAAPAQGAGAPPSAGVPIVSSVQATLNPSFVAGKTESLNMRWRLAFWKFQLRKWTHAPLFGVGFGRPTDFLWMVTGGLYDARNNPANPQDVTGPHNSFVNLLFRMGLAGALPLVALLVLAGVRLRRWLLARPAPQHRAVAVALVGVLTFVAATASFSVALEGPYMGMFFWGSLALLFVAPRLLEAEPGAQEEQAGLARDGSPALEASGGAWARGLLEELRAHAALPWPYLLMAAWTGILMIGGPVAAKAGLPGPIYPNEVVFAVALAALALRPLWRRERIAAVRASSWPPLLTVASLVFAAAFVVAAVRGYERYGRLIVKDSGIGYVLLVPLLALALVGRKEWANAFVRLLYWASLLTIPALVWEFGFGGSFNPLSLSLGYVMLFSVAPLLDDWFHGSLHWLGRLYVVGVPLFVVFEVASRSALVSLVVGMLAIVGLNLHGSRRQVLALGSVICVVVVAISAYIVAPNAVEKVPAVRIAEQTLSLAPGTVKGNNARWRLDFAGALLHRSVESPSNALLGVGLGKPSYFLWHQTPAMVEAYDYRNLPVPKSVIPNGQVSGPHNAFADIPYRLGWPALLAFVAILVLVIRGGVGAVRRASGREARSIRVLLATIPAGIVVVLTSDAIRVPEAAVPFACALGLLAAYGLTSPSAEAAVRAATPAPVARPRLVADGRAVKLLAGGALAALALLLALLAALGVFGSGGRAPLPQARHASTTAATPPRSRHVARTPRTTHAPLAILREGDRGAEVRALQRALTELGYRHGPVDGVYGPETAAAVARLQTASRLPPDGIYGRGTRAALRRSLAARASAAPSSSASP